MDLPTGFAGILAARSSTEDSACFFFCPVSKCDGGQGRTRHNRIISISP